MGAIKLARLAAPMVERFKDDLLGRLSWALAKKVLGSLKSIIAEAQRRGLVVQNVAEVVKIRARARDDRKLVIGKDIPSKQEISKILAAAEGRWRPLLLTAVFTGMRSSELRGLTWDAVDVEKETVHIRQRADQWGVIGSPKSEAGRRGIPMAPSVVDALREWKLLCPKAKTAKETSGRLWLVFPNGEGKVESHSNIINRGFGPTQVRARVADAHLTKKDANGQPVMGAKYGLHALRHFFASWIIEQGFSPKRVQVLLGHASIQMTFDVYGHLFPALEDDHAKFAAAERIMMG